MVSARQETNTSYAPATSGAPSISVVYIEMHSIPYEETLSKMGLVLMENLRCLMHCKSTIKSWTGFVFPKRSKRSVVCQVHITWNVEYLRLQVTYLTLKKDEVKGHIVQTLRKLLPEVTIDFPTPSGHLLGIALSTETLGRFGKNAKQVSTYLTIVVRVEEPECIYKYNWNAYELQQLLLLKGVLKGQNRAKVP